MRNQVKSGILCAINGRKGATFFVRSFLIASILMWNVSPGIAVAIDDTVAGTEMNITEPIVPVDTVAETAAEPTLTTSGVVEDIEPILTSVTLSGTVFGDNDNFGVWDAGEVGIAIGAVKITDYFDPSIFWYASAGIDGTWSLDVPPGYYNLEIQAPGDWTITYPDGNLYTIDGTIVGQANIDFGLHREVYGKIAGRKKVDTYGDATITMDDASVPGWTIYLDGDSDGDGTYDIHETRVTDADGYYEFLSSDALFLDADYTWRVTEDTSDTTWTQTYPPSGEYLITPHNTSCDHCNKFGNFQNINISGAKFNDANANGIWDDVAEETGLSGWKIYLDLDGSGNWEDGEPSTLTDMDGIYRFENLGPGTYHVREVQQTGWIRTMPAAPTEGYDVTPQSGCDATDADFGNVLPADVSITKADLADPVHAGGQLTYQLSIDNNGPNTANDVWVTDAPLLSDPEYSLDGTTWNPWTGSLALGTIDAQDGVVVLIRGTVAALAVSPLLNTASVEARKSFDNNLTNNQDDESTVLQYPVTFDEVGLPDGTSYTVTVGGAPHTITAVAGVDYSTWVTAGTNLTYSYQTPVPKDAHNQYELTMVNPTSPQVINAPTAVIGEYVSVPTQYHVTFDEVGMPDGTVYTITINGNLVIVVAQAGTDYDEWFPVGSNLTYGYQTPVPGGPGVHYLLTLVNPTSPQTITDNIAVIGTYIQSVEGTISGHKWADLDNDGTWDDNEPALTGWTITLTPVEQAKVEGNSNASAAAIETTITGADGSYSFAGVPEGIYIVGEVMQDGWIQTYPGSSGTHTVFISSQDPFETDVNFGNKAIGEILGTVFNDINANGILDPGEPRLSGWTVTLYADDGITILATQLSAADGSYKFDNLPPGTYYVSETINGPEWSNTTPIKRKVELNYINGEILMAIVDFGNEQFLPYTPDEPFLPYTGGLYYTPITGDTSAPLPVEESSAGDIYGGLLIVGLSVLFAGLLLKKRSYRPKQAPID